MRPARTLFALVALVAVLLGGLYVRKLGIERAEQGELVLFPALDVASLERLEVHHIERGTRLVLEADAERRWFLTEPVGYPADLGVVDSLGRLLGTLAGLPAEDGDDLATLGLDPPRVVVVWRAGAESGRLEVGRRDVDGARIYARADGRLVRTSVALANALELPVDDYRERRATDLEARQVISLRRRGSVAERPDAPARDLTLDALLEPERGWISLAPRRVALDPVLAGFLVRGAAELRVAGFARDGPGSLADYGLEPPALSVELEDERGLGVELLFGCSGSGAPALEGGGRWFAMRSGSTTVWSVEARSVGLLAVPREELYDSLVLRAKREDVVALSLGDVRAERNGEAWSLLQGDARLPADPAALQDLLAALEFANLEGFDAARELERVRLCLRVELRGGQSVGVELGQELADGRLAARRLGEELVGSVDAALLRTLDVPAERLRSRRVHTIEGYEVAAVAVGARRYERSQETGIYHLASPAGASQEAPEAFYRALERLLYLEALTWLPAREAEGSALAERVDVVIERGGSAAPQALAFGLDGQGRALCLGADALAAEVDRGLVQELLELGH